MSTDATASDRWLAGVGVEPAVFALRPDYRAIVITADGLRGGPTDETGDAALRRAEADAAAALAGAEPADLPHIAEWREAYRAFGAKPQRTRPSVEALLRRAAVGLPRIDRITDLYNAVSVSHLVPIGGEDRDRYAGSAQLVRAAGTETFDTGSGGQPVVERPETGEVVWRDAAGVTCRRWNWRQCTRTRITGQTTSAVFILDGLAALGGPGLTAAADALADALRSAHPGAELRTRLIEAPTSPA